LQIEFSNPKIEIFLCDQWFLALMNNGENDVLGVEAVCFLLKQFFGVCSAIDRD
jgi:hypothetical protein